jgi:hypothetical protein
MQEFQNDMLSVIQASKNIRDNRDLLSSKNPNLSRKNCCFPSKEARPNTIQKSTENGKKNIGKATYRYVI